MFTFLHQTDKFIVTGDMAAQTFWQWSDDIKPEDDITPFDGMYLDPDPALDTDADPSINKQIKWENPWFLLFCDFFFWLFIFENDV